MKGIRSIHSEAGLTLIEVAISFAIAGVSMVSLMMLFPKMQILVDVANHKVAAIRACQQQVEFIRASGFPVINPGVTQMVVTLDSGQDLAANTDDLRAVLTTTITNIFDGGGDLIAKKVLVQCQWNEHRAVVNEYLDLMLYRNTT